MKTPLCNALLDVNALNRDRFYVPAHAGKSRSSVFETILATPLSFDLTELPELDVLGNSKGVLADSQAQAAQLYGVAQTFYLINGASVGLMAALMASGASEGNTILVARNCHRAVVQGLILTGATPTWHLPTFIPELGLWGAVDLSVLESQLAQQPKAFVLTHPTYEGLPSDIAAVAALCQQYGVMLIVDEAHGALWPLSSDFPLSACEVGADIVVHSLHKSAGSLTQSALLHLPHGSLVESHAVQEALNVLQTTSPSYLLLASIESTMADWASDLGKARLSHWGAKNKALKQWIGQNLQYIQCYSADDSVHQLFLWSDRVDGQTMGAWLETEHSIGYEAATPYGVLLMLNSGLSEDVLERLKSVLLILDARLGGLPVLTPPPSQFVLPTMAMTPREAFFSPSQQVTPLDSVGCVSKQVVATCPPGIPILMPGEVIQVHHCSHLPQNLMVIPTP